MFYDNKMEWSAKSRVQQERNYFAKFTYFIQSVNFVGLQKRSKLKNY